MLKDRCLCLYTAGKLMKATGVRMGWILGAKQMIDQLAITNERMYSYNCPLLEKCVELNLEDMMNPKNSFMAQESSRLQEHRDIILQALVDSDLDIDIWVPQSSFFLLFDISRVPIQEKFMRDREGKEVTKDIGFAYQLAEETGVVMMPGCCYFGDQTEGRDRYIRVAFCKEKWLLEETHRRLQKNLK